MTPPLKSEMYSPVIMSLLPMLYIGWADNVLSPSEVQFFRKKLQTYPFLTDKDKALLQTLSDPKNPPSDKQMRHWVKLIRKAAETLPDDKRQTLVDLGIAMAKLSIDQEDLDWLTSDAFKALEEIDAALGVVSLETYRNLLTLEQRRREFEEVVVKPSFDVEKMQDTLDEDFGPMRQHMRILLKDPIFQYKTLRDKEDYRNQVLEWCKALADQGLGSMSYPTYAGGKGDMLAYSTVFEMLGFHDLSLAIKFGVQFGLFGGSIVGLGTEYHHKKYLPDTGTLKLAGCFAMTETGHGSNVRDLETTATYDKATDEIIIHSPGQWAGKEYIGNALHSTMASVFAQLIVNGENHGVHAILVPIRTENHELLPGVKVEDCGYKLGLNGVDNGRIWFDQVRVPRANLLNRFGNIDDAGNYSSPIESPGKRFFTMLGTLVGGRVCVPRAGLSAAKSGLTIAIKHALKRRQFGPADEKENLILDYPTHQRRLMPYLAKTYALEFALGQLTKDFVQTLNEAKDMRPIETTAAGLKAYATWTITKTLQECREACGGKGYLAENRFADLKADTDIFTTFEGDNTVLMQLVAKGLLSDFKEEFSGTGFMGVARFLVGQWTTTITEMNPFIKRNTDNEHICSPDFHLNAFEYRYRRLLITLGQRLRRFVKQGMTSYDAVLRCQVHMVTLATSYIEFYVLEQFQAKINSVEDENVKKILTRLCELYALSTIEEHRGWYLEENYIEAVKSKAIHRQVDKLCKIVRNEAGSLVDAFGIPDELLAAPIALKEFS